MNLRPGVAIGIEKQIAYLLSCSRRSEPGIDGQLVREGRKRGEHARPADEDPVLGVPDLV